MFADADSIKLIYYSAQQSTHPSAFLAEARGTPDYQASDFCHHTVEAKSMKKEDLLNLLSKNIGKTFPSKL